MTIEEREPIVARTADLADEANTYIMAEIGYEKAVINCEITGSFKANAFWFHYPSHTQIKVVSKGKNITKKNVSNSPNFEQDCLEAWTYVMDELAKDFGGH